MRLPWLWGLAGVLAVAGCTTPSPVPIKFPEDARVFSGVWTGSVFENPPPIEVLSGGSRVVLSRGQELLVLDAATGQQVSRLADFSGRVAGVSSDGSRVFELADDQLRVRDAATFQVSRTLPLNNEGLVRVSQDGSRYLTYSSSGLTVRAIADGAAVRTLSVSALYSEPVFSSSGQYVLIPQLTSGQPAYALWNVATASSTPLALPPVAPAAQLSPPPPEPQLRNFRFSADDGRLVAVYADPRQNAQRLLVWKTADATLEANLAIPDSGQQSVQGINLSASGDSGSLFVVAASGGRLGYFHQPWTLLNVGLAQEVTPLFSAYFRAGVSPNSVTVLTAGEAYLLSYLEFDLANNPATAPGTPVIKAAGVARVGSSAWEYRREAAFKSLHFEVQTRLLGSGEYAISGQAAVDGQRYAVAGRGGGGGVRFFSSLGAQNQPPTLSITLELTGPSGERAQLSAYQFASSGPSATPPRYTGTYSGPNSPSLRVELTRP